MIRLNLLPWREQRRHAAVRRFQATLVAGTVGALALVTVIDQLAQSRVREQRLANADAQRQVERLQTDVQTLDELRAARAALELRQRVLTRLRSDQALLPSMLAGLEQAMPSGLQLTELRLDGERVVLIGLAASPALVAQWVRELQQLGMLSDVEISAIRNSVDGEAFELLARLPARWS
ncbi:PilN domain-containing protein [Pseudomonas cremoricolorata]|uniref:PilN domain-containing protein n=1 Tax=Pseudomonas cremoricolorata TaxID=157783 RepID=UPI000411DDCC|nr:PilN domain-containing protein [Pseudomonas cremoricolorata]